MSISLPVWNGDFAQLCDILALVKIHRRFALRLFQSADDLLSKQIQLSGGVPVILLYQRFELERPSMQRR